MDLRNPAGIGIGALVYNYDGDVYASDESRMLAEMGDKTFRLGNVHADTWERLITSDALLAPLEESFAGSVPMCSDCAFQPYCGSEPVFLLCDAGRLHRPQTFLSVLLAEYGHHSTPFGPARRGRSDETYPQSLD